MSQQTRQYGGTGTTTSFTLTTSAASGTDYTSPMVLDTTGSNISGAYIAGAFTTLRPIRFTNLTMYFSSAYSGSVDLQIATAVTGAGGYQSGAITADGVESVTPNYSSFTNASLWYGFEKNSSATVRAYRSGSGGGVFENGSEILDGYLRANVTWQTAPNAPTSVAVSSKTNRSITLSWTKPADLGGPTALTGYRILYKESASSTWLSNDKFGTDATTSGTVSGLQPNTEYDFLVAATNSVTDAQNATYTTIASHTGTNSDQVTATTDGEVKVWTGSEFSPAVAKVWTGSEFATGEVYVWNGTEFVRAG
jgi:hypothetical protein